MKQKSSRKVRKEEFEFEFWKTGKAGWNHGKFVKSQRLVKTDVVRVMEEKKEMARNEGPSGLCCADSTLTVRVSKGAR